jgi:hypothetical protein
MLTPNKTIETPVVSVTVCFCLFVCLQQHKQHFSYQVAVTIIGGRAANLDLCLALMAVRSEGSFMCHTCCDT